MTNETSKVAIVTGASRGIGAAVAERLAGDGFAVAINYSGDTRSAEALARKIEGVGGRALTFQADVSDPGAVRGLFDAAEGPGHLREDARSLSSGARWRDPLAL